MILRKIRGLIRLFRPELPLAAGVCVALGEVLALGRVPSLWEIALGFASVFFLSGSAIVMNDYFDLDVDRVNMPERPIPAGQVSPGEAVAFAVVTTVVGLAASLAVGLPTFLVCALFGVIGFLYNWKFKEAGLAGNLMVAASVAVTFLLGGVVVGEPWNRTVWTFALMAFFIDFGEEIAGDAMDIEGDRRRGSKSIAILKGRGFALALSAALFGLAVVVSLVPVALGWLGTAYLVMISLVDVVIVVLTVRLVRSGTPAQGRQSMRGIYLTASAGMFVFLLVRLFL